MSRKKKEFGVKSYLHYFYEDCSGVGLCEVGQPNSNVLSGKHRKCRWFTCIGLCCLGFLLVVAGVALLILGAINSLSDLKTFLGGGLLCVGGITMAVCFTLLQIEVIKYREEILEQENFLKRCEQGMSIYREKNSCSTSDSESSSSPSDLPVTLYEVSAVQPLLEE